MSLSVDLGLVLASMGHKVEAIESYDAALRLKPDFGPAHLARAEVLYAMGRFQEAWRALSSARAAGVEAAAGGEGTATSEGKPCG